MDQQPNTQSVAPSAPSLKQDPSNPKRGFGVQASPFNGIKLELAIILFLAIVFWLVLDFITKDDLTQIGLLLIFSVLATAWLVIRTRKLLLKNTGR